MRDKWYRPPPEAVREQQADPEVRQQVDAQEASAFAAFLGAHQQVQQQTKGG